MKIKVISLSSSTRQRERVRRQLLRLGAPFEFSDAITERDALRHIHHYDEQKFILNCGRSATEREIACYASHLALWQRCASGDGPYLILEDNAELDESFLAGLLVVASQIDERGLIRVSKPQADETLAIDDPGQFEVRYCRRASRLALGYALSPKAATRLAHAGKVVEEPVHRYMQRFWRHGQPIYAMYPPIVNLALAAERSISAEHSPGRSSIPSLLRRAARKAQDSIARVRFNFCVSHRPIFEQPESRVPVNRVKSWSDEKSGSHTPPATGNPASRYCVRWQL